MVTTTNRDVCVVRKCHKCDKSISVMVNSKDFISWNKGSYIQNAMPYLSTDERELLISGTCGQCFDVMFAEEN